LPLLNIINPIALIVVRVALVVMYALSVVALMTIRGKLSRVRTSDDVITEVIKLKLSRLNMSLREYRLRRVPKWLTNGLLLGYTALTALLITYWFLGNALVGLGVVLLTSLIFVMTTETLRTEAEVKREITYLAPTIIKVRLRVKAPAGLLVNISDQLWEGAALISGEPKLTYLSDGREAVTEYVVGIGWGRINDYVVADLMYPLSVIRKSVTPKPETSLVTESSNVVSIKGLSKALSRELNVTEPSINYVRPYEVGDDLKLIVPKSLVAPGGIRVKVLERVLEESTEVTNPEVTLVLSNYVCNYPAGAAQLRGLLTALKYAGIKVVRVGKYLLSIDELVSNLRNVCRELHSVMSSQDVLGSNVAIVPPDALRVTDSSMLSTVITFKPVIDNQLTQYVSDWINSLRKSLTNHVARLRGRGINVKVVSIEELNY